MIKNLARIGVAVLTTLLILVMFWQFRLIVAYVLISLMLAASIRPIFRHLEGRKLFVRVGWILIYILVAGGIGFLLFLSIRASGIELQILAQSMSIQDSWTLPIWLGNSFRQYLIARLPSPSVLFQAIIGNEGKLVIPALLGIAQGVGGVITAIAIILILSVYWGINQIQFERLWLSLLPSEQRKRARGIWRAIEPEIGAYIRGQLIHSFIVGLLFGLGYWLIGSPYPVFLALAGALVCLIPVVGPILAVLLPLLIGLFTSMGVGLITVLYTIIILIALGTWVKPRLLNRKWDNPILTIILLIVLADVFGIFGIIIAPPLSVICQILWSRLVSHRSVGGASAEISDLTERLTRVQESILTIDDIKLPLVTSSVERISNLIYEAEPILKVISPVESSESSLHTEQEV